MKFPGWAKQRRIIAYFDSVKQQTAEPQTIQKQNGALLAGMTQTILAQAFRGVEQGAPLQHPHPTRRTS